MWSGKAHLGIEAHTLEIRAIEGTDNSVGEVPMLPDLFAQVPPDEPAGSISGDGACHGIAASGAEVILA